MKKKLPKPTTDSVPATPGCYEAKLTELTTKLYECVPLVTDVIEEAAKRPEDEPPRLEEMVRGMLVGGAGRGYEPAVRHAIRFYCKAYLERRKWEQQQRGVPETTRIDSLAAWNQELRERAQQLKLLEVEIVEVNVGDPIDEDLHSVNARDVRETERSVEAGTVAEVKSPAFRWRDDQGSQVVTHAEVIAFVASSGASTRADTRSRTRSRHSMSR